MRALVAFEHRGQNLRVGQQFSTTPPHAAALNYQRKAKFDSSTTQTRNEEAGDESTPPLQPQQDQPDVNEQDDEDKGNDDKGKQTPTPQQRAAGRGSYRRRDLRSEGVTAKSE